QQDAFAPQAGPLAGRYEESHEDEHADVGEGGQGGDKIADALFVDEGAVAQDVAGNEDRQHRAALGDLGDGVNEQDDPEREDVVVTAILGAQAVEEPDRGVSEEPANGDSPHKLPKKREDHDVP